MNIDVALIGSRRLQDTVPQVRNLTMFVLLPPTKTTMKDICISSRNFILISAVYSNRLHGKGIRIVPLRLQ
jgi:hypothetical protein